MSRRSLSIEEPKYHEDVAVKTVSTRNHRIVQTIADLVIIVIVLVIFAFVYFLVDPKIRHFYCNDTDIFFPYVPDTIPFWAIGIAGFLGPFVIILGTELFNIIHDDTERPNKRSGFRTFLIHFFHAMSLFIMGIAVTLLLTEIGKRWIGRLRPYFMSVCVPDYSRFNCTSNGLTGMVYNPISSGDICTGDANAIKEARYSFPSGHSSFSWFTMLFTIIYLEARLQLVCFRYVKTTIQMACFITAWVTVLSRVSDYHHRFTDILAGSILGIVVALFITLQTGRVLFKYDRPNSCTEVDERKDQFASGSSAGTRRRFIYK